MPSGDLRDGITTLSELCRVMLSLLTIAKWKGDRQYHAVTCPNSRIVFVRKKKKEEKNHEE